MARWKLRTPHYLNVPGGEWEYEEQDRNTNRRLRKRFEVPTMLNPDDPGDQTPPGSGEVIVCYEGRGGPRDHIFVGDPTPDMEPLDEEAQAISDSFKDKWAHPIDSLPISGDFTQSLLTHFQRQMDAIVKNAVAPQLQNASVPGVDPKEFAEMKEQLALLMKRNAELEEAAAATKSVRRA